jgi:hypothetical protein
MTMPAGQPFYPPNQIIRGGDGRTYMANEAGQLVPVNVTPAQSPGNPAQQQVPNAQHFGQMQQVPQQQAPAPQQQQQQQQALPPDTILRGPAYPPELQGRTVAQAMQIYAAMRASVGQNGGQQQQQQQAAPQQQQAAPQQQGVPTDPRAFFADPAGNTRRLIQEEMQNTLAPMLKPIMQQSAQGAIERARNAFLAANPTGNQYLNDMMPMLQRSTEEQLSNPETWNAVFRYVLGQKVIEAQANPQQPPYNPQQQQAPQWGEAVRQTPQGSFFTESSTPNNGQQQGQFTAGAAQLNSQELMIARQSGLTPEQYAQAKADMLAGKMPGSSPAWQTPQPNGALR